MRDGIPLYGIRVDEGRRHFINDMTLVIIFINKIKNLRYWLNRKMGPQRNRKIDYCSSGIGDNQYQKQKYNRMNYYYPGP